MVPHLTNAIYEPKEGNDILLDIIGQILSGVISGTIVYLIGLGLERLFNKRSK